MTRTAFLLAFLAAPLAHAGGTCVIDRSAAFAGTDDGRAWGESRQKAAADFDARRAAADKEPAPKPAAAPTPAAVANAAAQARRDAVEADAKKASADLAARRDAIDARLSDAIVKVANASGCDVVINAANVTTNQGEPIGAVVWAKLAANITAEVVRAYEADGPAKAKARSKKR